MKYVCHLSFSTLRKFVRDILGVKVSRGYLWKLIQKIGTAIDAPYNELLDRLPLEKILNVDETGHKENKEILVTALQDAPSRIEENGKEKNGEAQNMAKRFRDYGEAHFEFITPPGVDPTNNVAERAISFIVIDRHVTQGTRSAKGAKDGRSK